MMRLFQTEFQEELEKIHKSEDYRELQETVARTLTIATGKLAYSTIRDSAETMMKAFPKLQIHVFAIRNDFFGETVTVSGLITGQDLVKQLKDYQRTGIDLGDTLLITCNMLRSGEQVFLDDMTVQELEDALDVHLTAVENEGKDFIGAILHPEYEMSRMNDEDSFVYVQGYDRKEESEFEYEI